MNLVNGDTACKIEVKGLMQRKGMYYQMTTTKGQRAVIHFVKPRTQPGG